MAPFKHRCSKVQDRDIDADRLFHGLIVHGYTCVFKIEPCWKARFIKIDILIFDTKTTKNRYFSISRDKNRFILPNC